MNQWIAVSGGLMNPAHAVDIYIDLATLEVAIFRRRDLNWWHSVGSVDIKLLGLAVSEALGPKRSYKLAWGPCDNPTLTIETRAIVVVWRQNHMTLVATPFYSSGKPPDIVLDHSPSYEVLGNAVLAQARFSAAASALRDLLRAAE
jgi:hypothetical protein